MADSADANETIWKSPENVAAWVSDAPAREARRVEHRRTLAELLPFAAEEEFTFLDLGAGTGAASRAILDYYPNSSAILADYSPQMIGEGERILQSFAGRYRYVEFDLSSSIWPQAIPDQLDAVVSSMCVHHLPDQRKQSLFAEILDHLQPGRWYFNYDPVTTADPEVEAVWQRVNERNDPDAQRRRLHPTPAEHARHENHVRYMIPLEPQLAYLRAVGFRGVEVYWRYLDNVIYGGFRPA